MEIGGVVVARGLSTLMGLGVVIGVCYRVGNIRPLLYRRTDVFLWVLRLCK